MTNTDKGAAFEAEIKSAISPFFPDREYDVKTSKGSGNQRHDGDIQIVRREGLIKNLVYVECKNYKTASVPSLAQIKKAGTQGDRNGYMASIVVMKNKDNERIVSMRYQDLEFLLEYLGRHAMTRMAKMDIKPG